LYSDHKILIVEDNADHSKILSEFLSEAGYFCIWVPEGKRALTMVKKHKPTVAIIDLKLRDVNGMDVLKEIIDFSPETQCIILTGYSSHKAAIEAVNLGAFSYLQKPIIEAQVIVAVKRAIEKRISIEDLKTSEVRFRNAFEHAVIGRGIADLSGRFIKANQAFCEMLGYTKEEMLQKTIVEVTHPDDLQESLKYVQQLIAGEISSFRLVHRNVHKNGGTVWVDLNVVLVKGSDDSPIYMVGDIVDITDRKKIEEELKEANGIKELLLDVITHDLKNPAGVIDGMADVLFDEFPENEMVEVIRRSSNDLLNVIDNAKALARVSKGEDIEKVEIDLVEMLKTLAAEFESQLHESGMDLQFELPTKAIVEANPIIIEVFKNYLSNAIRYARSGKVITAEVKKNNMSVMVMIKDQGTTIPKNEQETVFQRNVQLGNGKKRGQGLGLAIAKRIALVHGAEVGVTQNEPKGNIFYLKIPA